MWSVTIAVLGSDRDAEEILCQGLNAFPCSKVYLLMEKHFESKGQTVRKHLKRFKGFKASVDFVVLPKLSFETIFETVGRITTSHNGDRVLLNVDTDYATSCIALSAAFVNGIQAIGIVNQQLVAYPIMKFSYYRALSDKKHEVLKKIFEKNRVNSLEELGKETGMSLPLVAYHVHGSKEKPGLETLGLIETKREKGRICIQLTPLGRLIVKGCVDVCEPSRFKR